MCFSSSFSWFQNFRNTKENNYLLTAWYLLLTELQLIQGWLTLLSNMGVGIFNFPPPLPGLWNFTWVLVICLLCPGRRCTVLRQSWGSHTDFNLIWIWLSQICDGWERKLWCPLFKFLWKKLTKCLVNFLV